ncbi:MAG: HWE histidine kinase domain-containing protein [Janthinobacterium lividum]
MITAAGLAPARPRARASDIEEILSLVGDGVVSIARDGTIILANRAAQELFGYSSDELTGCPVDVLIPERFHERHRADVAGFTVPSTFEHRAMGAGREVIGRHRSGREFAIEATLSRHVFGGEPTFTVVIRDVTARNSAERQRLFLANEVAHRLRNTMAVVASIVTLSARQASSVEDYRDVLRGRLAAISRTNDALIDGASADAGLSALIASELAPFRTRAGNVVLAGPEVRILGKQALDLALLLHELATNATKYGALSVPTGTIAVEWRVSAAPAVLDLVWQESDGPAVVPPERHGFGSKLISNCLRGHRGVVALTYPAGGVRCAVTLPLG